MVRKRSEKIKYIKTKFWFLLVVCFIYFSSFSSSTISVIGPGNDFSDVEMLQNSTYNFSVENEGASINQSYREVKIEFPEDFLFIVGSQGSSSNSSFLYGNPLGHIFLIWRGSEIVKNGTAEYFSFEATSPNKSGIFEFFVSVLDSKGVFESRILRMKVTDEVPPKINISSPEAKVYNDEFIWLNVSLDEKGSCDYSKDKGETKNQMQSYKDIDFSERVSFKGKVSINFYCTDLFGNLNDTEIISFRVEHLENEENKNELGEQNKSIGEGEMIEIEREIIETDGEIMSEFETGNLIQKKENQLSRWITTSIFLLFGLFLLIFATIKLSNLRDKKSKKTILK